MPKFDPSLLHSEPADHFARTGDRPPHEKLASEIKGMLVGCEYEYAEMTLRGILETVTRTRQVTEGQRNAVERIKDNPRGDRRRKGW